MSASVGIAACGQPAAPPPTTAPKPPQSAAPAASPPGAALAASPPASSAGSPAASPAAQAPAAAPASQKVNANTATIAEMQRAFEAAGIPNAARWAREVDEYRPYPTNDPSFGKLRQELAKYNPSPDVLQKILETLTV
jgi:hypothetical protein